MASFLFPDPFSRRKRRDRDIPRHQTETERDHHAEILDAVGRAKGFRLCLRRVWAVAASLPGRAESLPTLIPSPDMLSVPSHNLRHHEHEQCTFDFCEHSRVDFTSVGQRHEENHGKTQCHGHCRPLEFPWSVQMGEETAVIWKLDGQSLLDASHPYMAISHVWADGTGAGAWGPGIVNKCLWEFFCDIARGFQCEGCWWDTISIPKDDDARAKALSNMHNNYADARITLVHDLYLREWEWVDAETACFAIVMSPWYSRGWTALELAKSHKVKILFRARNARFVIKDLDIDILAEISPGSRQHAIADSIRKLRNASIQSVRDLLAILGPRDTSKPRDVPIISGLLAGVDVDGGLSQQEIYKRILRKLGKVAHGHLFHNSATMSSPGFDWCPTNILDMPLAENDVESLDLRENGDLEGVWKVYPTGSVKQSNLIWENVHPLTQISLRSALKGKRKHQHVFLVEEGGSRNRALLVRFITKVKNTACCRFVGPVYFRSALGGNNHNYRKTRVRIGSTEVLQELSGEAWEHFVLIDGPNEATGRSFVSGDAEVTDGDIPDAESQEKSSAFPIPTGFKDWKAIFYSDLHMNKKDLESLFTEGCMLSIPGGYGSKPNETMNLYFKSGPGIALFYGHKEIIPKVQDWLKPDQSHEGEKLMVLSLDEDDRIKVNLQDESARRSLARRALLLATGQEDSSRVEPLVTLLLNHKAPHNFGRQGPTPLHLALERKNYELIEKLLTHETNPAKPDAVNEKGETALHLAAKIDGMDGRIAELLVEKTDNCDSLDDTERTALHLAAIEGNVNLAEHLVNGGASTNLRDFDGHSPLHYAAFHGHNAIVTAILKRGAKFNDDPNEQINEDLGRTSQDDIRENAGGSEEESFGEQEKTAALHVAAQEGHELVVKTLMQRHANVYAEDTKGWTALMLAAKAGHAPVVYALLGDRTPENFQQQELDNCLLLAAKAGAAKTGAAKGKHGQVISMLVDGGAKSGRLDSEGMTALHWAIEAKDDESAKLLITCQTDLNVQDFKKKRSALILAADKGLKDVVVALLARDQTVEVKLQDSDQRTALHWAAIRGNLDIMKALLGCKNTRIQDFIDEADNQGRKALHWAAYWIRTNAMKPILDENPQYDTKDNDDCTPLMLAAEIGNLEGVKQLLLKKVPPLWTNKKGMTALGKAAINGHGEIVSELLAGVKKDKSSMEADKAKMEALKLAVDRTHLLVAMQLQESINDVALRNEATSSILFLMSATADYPPEVENFIKGITDPDRQNTQGQTALMLSVENENLYLTGALLGLPAKTDLQDTDGKTALIMAATSGRGYALRMLMEAGANPRIQDNRGYTALHHAVEQYSIRHVERLCLTEDSEGFITIADKHKRTALHIAMQEILPEMGHFSHPMRNSPGIDGVIHYHFCRMLLESRARLDAKDAQGQTPLHLAVRNHPQTATRILTRAQVSLNPNVQNDKKETPLLLAAEAGHWQVVKALLRRQANPNLHDAQGRTPLSQAARNGHGEVVNVLLEFLEQDPNYNSKSELDARDDMGRTALLLAAENGHFAIVETLSNHGATTNMMDFHGKKAWQKAMDKGFVNIVEFLLPESGQSIAERRDINEALLVASRRGWTPLAEVLLRKGADKNFQNGERCTALHMAAMSGQQEMVEVLLKNGTVLAIEDEKGRTALLQATEHGFGSIVGLFLARDEVKCDIDGWKVSGALLLAAEKGYTKIVELILESTKSDGNLGVDLNLRTSAGKTAIALAAAHGNRVIVELLLRKGADSRIPDDHQRTALHHAAWGGYDDVVEILLKHDVNLSALDKRQQSALHLAAERASDKVVERLLEKRVNFDAKSVDGQTSLHRAAWGGSHRVVALLCSYGADIHIRDGSKNRPWQVAAEKGHESIVEQLLSREEDLQDENILNKKGLIFAAEMGYTSIARSLLKRKADADTKDENGLTPLHWAMKRGDQAFVDLLLEKDWRPPINALDREQRTPLCHGVLEGRAAVVQALLRNNADPNIPDKDRQTVLHHAARRGDWEMVRILIHYKADPHARDDDRKKAWQVAAKRGDHQTVEMLLKKELDLEFLLSRELEELLLQMVEQDRVPMVELLLGLGVNKDAKDRSEKTALGLAAELEKHELLELLLSKGADQSIPDLRKMTPILWAAKSGNTQIINALLDNANFRLSRDMSLDEVDSESAQSERMQTEPANITESANIKDKILNQRDGEHRTPLLIALKEKHDEVAKLLLEKGGPEIKVNLEDNTKTTALHLAVCNVQGDNNGLVKLLLSKQADQSKQDELGRTALLIAAEQGKNTVVEILLESSSEFIDSSDLQGHSALLVAAELGNKKMIEMLLSKGADSKHADRRGRTALHIATENGSRDIVGLLLSRGAKPTCQDSKGRTPLRLAVTNGDEVLVGAFLQHPDIGSLFESEGSGQELLQLAVKSGNKGVTFVVAGRTAQIPRTSD